MRRLLVAMVGALAFGLLVGIADTPRAPGSQLQPADFPGPGLFFRNPKTVYASQAQCQTACDPGHKWGTNGVWSMFHVVPKYWTTPTPAPAGTPTATPRTLSWQEHTSGNIPPVVVKVSWGGSWETLEIFPDHSSAGSANIIFHDVGIIGCDGEDGRSSVNFDPGGAPCISSVDFDIDWDDTVGGNQWDWIYFWVRDPDFVSMKAVNTSSCPTQSWPYEYVNAGPKYSICQWFSDLYYRTHGVLSYSVNYDVLYQEGVPPTPTSGPTTTPPSPVTPTPCSDGNC